MATVSEIVQSLNALIAEGSSIAGEKGEVPLLNEKLDQWTRRVHGMLSNWGRGQDANRFSGASYSAQLGQSDRERFWGRAEARLRVLRVLRDDMAAHPEFYEVRDTPKLARETRPILPPKPNKVFLGHGGNPLWSKVHTHLKDELQLNVQAWESESRASMYPLDVLKQLLDSCTFAVLVQTGEDATSDGILRARQNVIHEIGLFQGRLGFEKVALVEQDGIESFSNIQGLQVIRFPGQKIEAAYYELDRMLVREKLIQPARA